MEIILRGDNPYIHIAGVSYEDSGAYVVDQNGDFSQNVLNITAKKNGDNNYTSGTYTDLKNGLGSSGDKFELIYSHTGTTDMSRTVYLVDNNYSRYMFTDNISKFFDKDNKLTNRQLQIDNNFIKSHRDYIDLIKILVYAFILIIPLLILTKINFISKPVAIAFSSFILILALLYIVYHLIFKQDAYLKRDKKNYDLIKIEDNMRHKKLVKSGIIDDNDGIISQTYRDCVGDQCCTDYMTYDGNIRQCIPTNINVGKYWKKASPNPNAKDITDISMIVPDDNKSTIKDYIKDHYIDNVNFSIPTIYDSSYIILPDSSYNLTNLSSLASNNTINIGDYISVNNNSYVIVNGIETFTNMSDNNKPINPCTNSCFNNITDLNIDFFAINIDNNSNSNNNNKIEWSNTILDSILSPFSLDYKEPFSAKNYMDRIKEISNNITNGR